MKTICLAVACFLAVPLILIPLAAQQPQKPGQELSADIDVPISVDVNIVNLYFAVRNKQNGLINSLTKSDFDLILFTGSDGRAEITKRDYMAVF